MSGPAERFWDNAVEITSTLVTGVWMAALFTGQDWWLAALLVGYIVVVPIVSMLAGEDEDGEEWDWSGDEESDVDETATESTSEDADDALEALRERYARGELTDVQFERKLERLLEVETVEDASEYVDRERLERRREETGRNRREPEYE